MTAKSKRAARDVTRDSSESSADPRESSGICQRTARRHEELLDEVRALRRAGKIREAKGIEGRAQQVEQLLGALESEGGAAARALS